MSTSDNAQAKGRRSREGCVECRRRHRKCDETRPSCQNCLASSKTCVYARQISFGGRPFSKSRFGKCLEANVMLINSEPPAKGKSRASFFYGLKNDDHRTETASKDRSRSPYQPLSLRTTVNSADDYICTPGTPISRDSATTSLLSSPSSMSMSEDHDQFQVSPNHIRSLSPIMVALPLKLRPSLEYFVHRAAIALSSNRDMHHAICTTFIPMALETPHLLSAMMAVVAAHRQSIGLDMGEGQLRYWQLSSIEQLRLSIAQGGGAQEQGALATSLMLCLTEAVSNDEDAGRGQSWRAHLRGASTLLKLMDDDVASAPVSRVPDTIKRIHRCLMTIASCMSLRYNHMQCPPSTKSILQATDPYIDEFLGYSTNLLPIFEEVKTLSISSASVADPTMKSQTWDDTRAHQFELLANRVHTLLDERQAFVQSEIENGATQSQKDLLKLDEAYHHAALLVIYNRGYREMPQEATRKSIDCIIECIQLMSFDNGAPAPVAGSLPPLFMAGCLSHDPETRQKISYLLEMLWRCYGMGNVRSTQSYLLRLWGSTELTPEQKDPFLNASRVLELTPDAQGHWDFLPY